MEGRRSETCTYLERKENHRINQTLTKHREEFGDIKSYYNDITHSNLDLIKSLKVHILLFTFLHIMKDKDAFWKCNHF